jgi:hypothetical protein
MLNQFCKCTHILVGSLLLNKCYIATRRDSKRPQIKMKLLLYEIWYVILRKCRIVRTQRV